MTSLTAQGYAIRRANSCLGGVEVDCGQTLAPFRACCPSGSTCPIPQYNVVCCSPGQNCTESLLAAPQPVCANATWDLFDNGGYFCCEHGLPGYKRSNTNGCAQPNVSLPAGIQMLSTVRVGVDPATMVSSASPTASTIVSATGTILTTPTPSTPASQPSSSTPVGAIAGGVVGGVAGLALLALLAWFFMRRKRSSTAELSAEPYLLNDRYADNETTKYRSEVGGGEVVHEMSEQGSKMPDAELSAMQKPVELDAQERARS